MYTLPPLVLSGYGSSQNWGGAISTYNINHGILYNGISGMQSAWNRANQPFDPMSWVRSDGPVQMIGGIGDPAGIFDVGGQVISNWEPENRYLAMGVGLLAAFTLKKPGLAKVDVNIAEKEMTTIYRNFGWNELNSIKNSGGKFSIHPNQFQGKQFWVAESVLKMWTNSRFAKPFTAKVSIPKSFVTPGHKNYIFMESDMIIDGFPGGTVLPNSLQKFNSAINIEWIRY